MKRLAWFLVLAPVLIVFIAYIAMRGDFVKHNVMDSVPRGWWLWLPGTPVEGDVVFFRNIPNSDGWLSGNMPLRVLFDSGFGLLKPVMATSGRVACRDGRSVTIDGIHVGDAREADKHGCALPSWHGCHVIEDGEYFVMSTAVDDSLDSVIFGVLPAGTVVGRYIHVWP